MRATCVRRRRCRAEQQSSRAAFALVLCCALCVRCVCFSVCLPCLVCFTFILATGRGCSNVPMFDCSTVSTAFAYSNDDTCVRSRYSLRRRRRRRRRLLIGLCCYSSSLFVLLLVLLLLFVVIVLLFQLSVGSFRPMPHIVVQYFCATCFEFFYILRIPLPLPLSLSLTCCCCWFYVRAKLLVKCLSGAESLTQFSLVHCTSHDSQTC